MRIQRLVLASQSPRRRELLRLLAPRFEVVASQVDENGNGCKTPDWIALELARLKARDVAAWIGEAIVIGADTVIDLEGLLLGKPSDPEDARRMLQLLSGRRHEVLTGLAVVDASNGCECAALVGSSVVFREYSSERVERYVASSEPLDKAGAYAIQGLGRELIAGFTGCYNNIVGLPLCELGRLLGQVGWAAPIGPKICRLPDGSACPRYLQRPAAPAEPRRESRCRNYNRTIHRD